jgi:DNA-binding NtrC family response regulator
MFAVLERVAASEIDVLIHGESGTGKELVATELVQRSARADGPVVVVDCGSISPNLVESELFGHVRGAFTGADREREGAFEAADGGTLFLDEIGELPLELQPKLLRALEAREVRRVGQTKMKRIDVRVIAATNRDLEREVNRGRFREDLYYRLAKVSVRVPSLRDRLEDMPLLVTAFLASLGGRDASKLFSPAVIEEMQLHDWPGNVRELKNYIERSVVLDDVPPASRRSGTIRAYGRPGPGEQAGGEIRNADARTELRSDPPPRTGSEAPPTDVPFRVAKESAIAAFEKAYLAPLIERCNGNVSQAAREARMDRMYLHQLAQKHGFKVGRKG